MKTKTWKLPKPEKVGGEWEWVPLVRVGRFLPFGYRQDPSDADILLPVPEELELFEQAKKHLSQYSYREVSAWLSETSGRYISHVGLFKRVKIEQKRKAATSIQRFYAEKYKEAAEKAEKLESNRLGKRQPVGESSSPGKASTD
mgnify:FL=1|jgi:hypothetical protein|tara:strand:+ start:402 stop:833 length:432 start_codon:yes stop_codon:yes gene_type:complete